MDEDFRHASASVADEPSDVAPQAPEALRHLRMQIRAGVVWHRALLEAVGLWTLPQEGYQGRTYHYLIRGEAFDWLVLAERLCEELESIIPAVAIPINDKESLLFSGRLPKSIDPDEFKDLLGVNKYRAYLNFWYGVVVEEALQLSVEEDVRKRHIARCYADTEELVEEAFVHLYGATKTDLIEEFQRESKLPNRDQFSLSNIKEFTYWAHKRRLNIWDPARVASDTNKGIRRLHLLQESIEAARERVGV